MALNDLFSAARAASEPPDGATERVLQRIRDADGTDVERLLAGAGEPDPAAVRRVAARLRASRRRPLLLGALTLSAAAGLWAMLATPPTGVAPEALDVVLDDAAGHARTLTRAVEVEARGEGRVGGTVAEPHVDWERGELLVRVDPEAGIHLVVDTPESRVTVLGTVFSVVRTPLGTEVTVERGEVAVACRDTGTEARLGPGEVAACRPSTAAGLLGRARTLEARGASFDEVVAALSRALELDSPAVVRGEILAQQIRIFRAAGRRTEALLAAQQYLDEGHTTRRKEVQAFVESLGPAP
ncbi:MAG: FecR domain-containing protein [Myxococcota bacterium]